MKGLRSTECGGDDENKPKIINLWELYVKSAMFSGEAPLDFLQIEIDVCLLNRKLEVHKEEDDIARNHVTRDGDDENGG